MYEQIKRETTMKKTSPWTDNKAFEPMFDEVINITSIRDTETLRQSLNCCVFSDCTGETLYEGNVETDRQDIMIVCDESDWKFVQTLKTGDKVKRLSNEITYVISSVKKDAFWGWIITARGA